MNRNRIERVAAIALATATTLTALALLAAPRSIAGPEGDGPEGAGPEVAAIAEARDRMAAERWDEAVEAAERATEVAPESADAWLVRAEALREKMSRGSRLRAMMTVGGYKRALRRALELDPDHVGARAEEIGYLLNAPSIAGGDAELADEKLGELEALDEEAALSLRYDIARSRGDDAAAIAHVARLVELAPGKTARRINYGLALQRAERWAEADVQFRAVLDGPDPRHALAAVYQLGRSRVLGKYEPARAVVWFDQFLRDWSPGAEGVPSRSGALWRRGQALETLGKVDAARESYRRALELDAEFAQAREALEALSARD